MQTQSSDTASEDRQYDAFLLRMQLRYVDNAVGGTEPVFTTDVDPEALWKAYLEGLPEGNRQYHTCNACRHFIMRYGGLVVIDAEGVAHPLLWHVKDAPPYYQAAVGAMLKLIRRTKVTGVFYSGLKAWGTAENYQGYTAWKHFAITPMHVHKSLVKTAGQFMAEKREDRKTMARALSDFTPEHVSQAVTLLRTEALYRAEKVLGAAEWLEKVHATRSASNSKAARENLLWRAVALAPAGFCHPRSSMIGSLLEDLAAGLPYADVSKKFAAKMSPLQYQRPQAPPSAGNVKQAETLFNKLGLAPSLRRRFARLEELETVWAPKAADPVYGYEQHAAGVFAHLLTPTTGVRKALAGQPPIAITWAKFAATVLPEATTLEYQVAPRDANYCAYVTAADPEAPPILQWDTPQQRNPVSLYVYTHGSSPERWGLRVGWVKVTGVSLKPNMWNDGADRYAHQSKGVLFVLEGAKDVRCNGLALFPENLQSELHEVRRTIEAYSKGANLEGANEATACGVFFSASQKGEWPMRLRATTRGHEVEYNLDRWD